MGRVILVALVGFCACARAADVPVPTSFFLAGQVRDVREGVEPIGVTIDAALEDEGTPSEGGELAVRPDPDDEPDGLDGCRPEGDVHAVYYTTATVFDPPRTPTRRGFPRRLKNAEVTISGLVYALDVADEISGCTLVAKRIDVRPKRG